MPNINQSYLWVINTCNAPNIGYSQQYRAQQTVNGITYYDCSSLMWYALKNGGFDVEGVYGTYPFYTGTMHDTLVALGFTPMSTNIPWLAGDILLRTGHTEMVYNGRVTMGAHSANYPLDKQVSINTGESESSDWETLYRYDSGVNPEYLWVKGNRYLTLEEMQNNAFIIYSILYFKGWTLNAIAGMLGNMQTESTINPGIWQSLIEGSGGGGGYGLVQWSPWTNYTDWADSKGYEWDNGNAQCEWIETQTVPFGQWIETTQYPISWEEFKVSTASPEELAYVFLYNFERPASLNQPNRQTQARYWYDYLSGMSPVPPTPSIKKKKMPLYMMLRYF